MSDNANLKNDVVIKGAGLEYTLRPSFGCMIAIENKSNKSLLKIIDEMANGQGKLTDLIIVLREGSRAGGLVMTDKEIESLIENEGVLSVQKQLTSFFVQSLYGGRIHEDQAKKKAGTDSESLPE